MTVLADLVVANDQPADAPAGHRKSAPFEAGGRLVRNDSHGVEQFNAVLALDLPTGGTDVDVRVIVNGHPLPQLVAVTKASQRTAVVTFPASHLRPDSREHRGHQQGHHHLFGKRARLLPPGGDTGAALLR